MTRSLLSLILLLTTSICTAQKIRIIDEHTHHAIEDVYVFSSQNSCLTNKHGLADLSSFTDRSSIHFQHPSYQNLQLNWQQIKNANFLIKMKSSIFPIDEIVVSANKWEQNTKEVPQKVLRIEKQEILASHAPTSAELLRSCNQVYIQKSQLGGGSPMIRGFAANRVLLVLDGMRLNNAIYRSGNLQNVIGIDPNSLESAEIILGPGSTIYGSDAIGGVMDFHTITPHFSTSEKENISLRYKNRYASANNEIMNHGTYNFGKKKISMAGSISYVRFGDQRMGKHGPEEYLRDVYAIRENGTDIIKSNSNPLVQKQSGYRQFNSVQKIRYRVNQDMNLQYAFYYTTSSDIPRYDRLIQFSEDTLKYAEWYYGPQKLQIHNLKLNAKKPCKIYDSFQLNAGYQKYRESRHDRKFDMNTLRNRSEKLNIYTLNADAEKKLSETSQWFYGLEFTHNRLRSKGNSLDILTGSREIIASRYPDHSKLSSLAFYSAYKHKLNEKWILNTGLRFSRVWIDSELDESFYNFPFTKLDLSTDAINGALGLTYNSDSGWNLKLNASTGFRAPNIDDIGKVFDSEPGKVVVPNPNLKPEYIYNFDCNLTKNFNQIFFIDFSAFYSYLDKAMVRSNFSYDGQTTIFYDGVESKVQAITNADYAKVYGGNVRCILKLNSHFSSSINYNYSKGKYKDGSSVRHVPPQFGSWNLDYQAKQFKSNIRIEYNSKISYKNLASVEKDKAYLYTQDRNGKPYSPSWITLNWKSTYEISKTLSLHFAIENILNKRYRNYSSGIANTGRNFVVGLVVK